MHSNMQKQNLKFSIIIPSYNEKNDIRLSVESAIAQSYPNKEILVVDDSNDNTPDIIKEYENKGVRYLKGDRKGCCGARNLGIKKAGGDVVVLLNADVSLPSDFLERIHRLYNKGADYVLVESRVINQDNFWARFIEAQHRYEVYRLGKAAEWTEGFSCRRQAALDVGLIPGDFSVRFCRDWLLGKNLGKAGYKKVIDRSIVVTHKAPDNFKEYWCVRKARGRFGALMQYFLYRRSAALLFLKFVIKDIVFLLKFLTVVPALIKTALISKLSAKPIRDFLPFLYAYFIQELTRALGEWEGWFMSLRSNSL